MKVARAGDRGDTSWPADPGTPIARLPESEPEASQQGLRFVDLFAGLGGFHLALKSLDRGHTCVFASELNGTLRSLYKKNFGIDAHGDITKVNLAHVPDHDVLCAGFPCQPFSKSGKQHGLKDPLWGNLYDYILQVLKRRKPRYFILENVPNLERHGKGETWKKVRHLLSKEGYEVKQKKLSPHRYGIPQVRERLFVVGSRGGLDWFDWPHETHSETSIFSILESNPPDAKPLSDQVLACIQVWQEFLDRFPIHEELPSFPIWAMEFGATYPYKRITPFAMGLQRLSRYRGAHGQQLRGLDENTTWTALPSHARTAQDQFPSWKVRFIKQNRDLYERHRNWIDGWKGQLLQFPSSLQKLEWNCKGEPRQLNSLVLQFRASGMRVKRTTTAPSLIASTTTQVPIITWESRYMTARECAKLQSMEGIELPESPAQAYAALGNAVNVDLVARIARALLERDPGVPVEPKLMLDDYLNFDERGVTNGEDVAVGEPFLQRAPARV